jgi:uncharacterized NAD(P)/FAD-binding protein YdhS
VTDADPFRVAIVGAGAAGALVAVHLLRAGVRPIALIDPGPSTARGVAYGTRFPRHLLNVEARVAGGLAGEPEHFVEWLNRPNSVSPRAFVSRGVYGDYLTDLFERSVADAPVGSLDRLHAEVVDMRQSSGGYALTLGDGAVIMAESVVLATGPPPPPDVPLRDGGWPHEHSGYVRNPWLSGVLGEAIPPAGHVLLVGTGPTTIDVVLQLAETHPRVRMTAVSRRGLLPTAHRRSGAHEVAYVPLPAGRSLREQVRAFRTALPAASADGADGRDLVDAMRPYTQRIWKKLSPREQERFLASLMRAWTVHRSRMPPDVADWIRVLAESGRFEVVAGRLVRVDADDPGRLNVAVEHAGGGIDELAFDAVVNCAGPADSPFGLGNRLYDDLAARGLAQPHPLGLGIDTGDCGAVRARDGELSDSIFAVGWLRRGELWESVAIPEIRDQAGELAARLAHARP